MAAETRRAVEMHDEWDSLHCFLTLHWDGEKLTCGTYAAIDPGIEPAGYPALMAKLAREAHEGHPDEPPGVRVPTPDRGVRGEGTRSGRDRGGTPPVRR